MFDSKRHHDVNRDQWDERIYSQEAQLNRYPYDAVVSFIFRHAPAERKRTDVRILEVGCGAGNNLWFAAREGFQVAGVDGSTYAIRNARSRFAAEGLYGDLRVGDFRELPYDEDCFDLAIERAAYACCSFDMARQANLELWRVMKPGACVFMDFYSQAHTSYRSGRMLQDRMVTDIRGGSVQGVGDLCFYDRGMVDTLAAVWTVLSLEHMSSRNMETGDVHSEWRMIVKKPLG